MLSDAGPRPNSKFRYSTPPRVRSLHPDEKTPSVLTALHQAVEFYKAHGVHIQRVLTDRGSTYRSKLFAAACKQLGLRHLFTKPYRPQTNAKAERFIQTITRE